MNQEKPVRKLVANFPRYTRNWLRWLVVLGELPPDSQLPLLDRRRRQIRPKKRQPSSIIRYAVSSLLLHKCYRHLTRRPTENMHLVTGINIDGCFVMTDIVILRAVKRAMAGAFADATDVRKGLILMESFGLRCGGLFHSHPGTGIGSTHPSKTDWQNQKTWERAYPLIGCVFSRDGYVRFFGSRDGFQVIVHGKKVKKIDENLYKLEVD